MKGMFDLKHLSDKISRADHFLQRGGKFHERCEAETRNLHKPGGAKVADRYGRFGYEGARRKRLARRNPSRGRRRCEPPNMSHIVPRGIKSESAILPSRGSPKVPCIIYNRDLNGVEHAVEVTADSVYELKDYGSSG